MDNPDTPVILDTYNGKYILQFEKWTFRNFLPVRVDDRRLFIGMTSY